MMLISIIWIIMGFFFINADILDQINKDSLNPVIVVLILVFVFTNAIGFWGIRTSRR
jgi:hypothetical protein